MDGRISVEAACDRTLPETAGVLLGKPEDVGRYAALGFTFFGLSSEAMMLDRAVRSALETARHGFATATNQEVR